MPLKNCFIHLSETFHDCSCERMRAHIVCWSECVCDARG